jgi:hypothetical protein
MNGFGGHRIEGIGDKHIPWIHNVRNTDGVAAIDDEDCMRILRLFNEAEGVQYCESLGIPETIVEQLSLLGISGICNMLAAIKTAKYFEMDENDVLFTVFTDSVELYGSRLRELEAEHGKYSLVQAAKDHAAPLLHQSVDYFRELSYYDRKAIHNLKYYTWVEQQGKSSDELNAQWDPAYWQRLLEKEVEEFDALITGFNGLVG